MALTHLPGGGSRLRRIAIVVADLDAAAAFYAAAFAFEFVERRTEEASFAIVLGLPGAKVRQIVMRLGAQEIGLLAFDPPGRPYPVDSTSTDLWFQHFAIVVSDMAAAYARLATVGGFSPISEGGPQRLPPNSGSVSAFKFRDADGHPLELLAFPEGSGPACWQDGMARGLVLGIDHSAIAVSDTARSIAFYQRVLGLGLGEQTDNAGPAQTRLDAVRDAVVTVTGLNPAHVPPHVELLGYAVGTRRPIPQKTAANDVAATVLVVQTDELDEIVLRARAAKAEFVSPGIVALADGRRAATILDPDGHRILIVQ